MADEDKTTETQPQEPEDKTPHGDDPTDWKAMARKWEKLAKENKTKADAYDEAEEKSKSELQKAKERAENAEKELAAEKSARELESLKAKVSKEKNVPPDLLAGTTEEELIASAEAHLAWKTPAPAKLDKIIAALDKQ